MYKSTKWLDQVVDADTGEVIQEGTDQRAANFNNLENGISDAHVAGAIMQIALNRLNDETKENTEKIKVTEERIAVIDGSFKSGTDMSVGFPEGFNSTNCIVISKMSSADGVLWFTHDCTDASKFDVELSGGGFININTSSNESTGFSGYYKIVLYKYK